MAWTSITITRDPGNSSICTGSALFVDAVNGNFNFSKTVTYDVAGKDSFVTSAKAALAVWQTKRTGELAVEADVLAALNA